MDEGLHRRRTTHYTEKKLRRQRLYGRTNYIEDGEGLYGEGLHRGEIILYERGTIQKRDYIKK